MTLSTYLLQLTIYAKIINPLVVHQFFDRRLICVTGINKINLISAPLNLQRKYQVMDHPPNVQKVMEDLADITDVRQVKLSQFKS